MNLRSHHLYVVGANALDLSVEDRNADRRVHDRLSLRDLPWLKEVRLKYGPRVTVLDISPGGLLIETEGYRLDPGRTVALEIAGASETIVMPAGIVRCQVAGISPQTVYRGGLAFKRTLELRSDVTSARPAQRPTLIIPDPLAITAAAPQPSGDEALAPGWHRLVVRYIDGRLLKGYGREFAASSGSLHVWPEPDAAASERVTVPLWHVKAVFFVRNFIGNSERLENAAADGEGRGRRVAITFLDNETLVGTTLNYNPEAVGFFLQPADAGSNNVRVFVACRAICHVRFL